MLARHECLACFLCGSRDARPRARAVGGAVEALREAYAGHMSPRSAEEIWRDHDAMEVRLSAPLSELMLGLAQLGPGMRVLDLATGRGEPAIWAAHRVGSGGRVVGVDPSAAMLAMAAARAVREGIANLELRVGDAADPGVLGPGPYDAVLCRWGVMYMAQPHAALAAVRNVASPDAQVVFAVFVEPARVSYFTEPRRFLPRECAAPAPDFEVPGPFRFAPAGKLERALEHAGFRVTHVEEVDVPVTESRDVSEVVAWCRDFGVAKLLSGLPPAADAAWAEAFGRALEQQRAPDGFIRLGGVTRVVRASRA